MRTTLNLPDALVQEARRAAGITEKTKLVQLGLRTLIQETARKRLAQLYGEVPTARKIPRRRSR